MKVLVTGASGFLGSYLVKALLEQKFEVLALVRNSSELDSLKNLNCQVVIGDILDLQSLLPHFEGLDGVFHVAGAMSSSPKDRQRLFEVNVEGVKNIISACTQKNIKKLVHVSSVVAVGSNLKSSDPLLTESSINITKDRGFGNYDSKRLGEELVLAAAKKAQLNAVVVNPGLIYGAGDAKKIIRHGNVLAAKGKLPLYPSGGVNIVAVEDVTAGIIEAFKKGKNGERYLLTGDNITIKDLLTTISNLAGAKAPSKELPTGLFKFLATMLDYLGFKTELCRENIFSASTFHWYDNTKARRELGFKPRSYRKALKSSVDWMKENHYL
ncbi:MAG: NAD-dependent epimerase/dehydratase family protein [Bacteriovorax sp.]|nr:NAD-dependent epimerase/dehydratase family protein [Bacteriovorax sp.]